MAIAASDDDLAANVASSILPQSVVNFHLQSINTIAPPLVRDCRVSTLAPWPLRVPLRALGRSLSYPYALLTLPRVRSQLTSHATAGSGSMPSSAELNGISNAIRAPSPSTSLLEDAPTPQTASSLSSHDSQSFRQSPPPRYQIDPNTPSDADGDVEMPDSGSEVDAQGSADGDFSPDARAGSVGAQSADAPSPLSEQSTTSLKRKKGSKANEFMTRNPELYGLRRSVSLSPAAASFNADLKRAALDRLVASLVASLPASTQLTPPGR
jgi:hypothetical protein